MPRQHVHNNILFPLLSFVCISWNNYRENSAASNIWSTVIENNLHTHTHTWCTRPWAEQGVQWCDVQAALCVKAILRQNIHYEWSRAFCRGKAVSAGGVQVSIFEKSFDKLYLRNVRYTLVPPCHFVLLSFFVRKPDNIQRKCVFFCTHVFSESCCNIIALLLQAWRRYDTDRSGYIESNELKGKHNMPNSASCSWLM